MGNNDLHTFNQPLQDEILFLITQYDLENEYPKYLHIRWLREYALKNPESFPLLKSKSRSAICGLIARGINYLYETDIVRSSDSGHGTIYLVRSRDKNEAI